MKSKYYWAGVLAAVLLSPAWPVMAATFALESAGGEALYRSQIPLEVYQYTRQYYLQDMFVTNAAGERVPHTLLSNLLAHPQAATETSLSLPIFPLQASALGAPDDLRLLLEKGPDKTTLSVTQNSNNAPSDTVFILDAGKTHPRIEALKLDWNGAEGRLVEVELLASDDLNHWVTLANSVLLKTSNASGTVLQNMIRLDAPSGARYLQIRAVDDKQKFVLTGAEARMTAQTYEPARLLWQALKQTSRTDDAQQSNIEFESPGHYPAESLHLALPQENTITTVRISVRNQTSEPWRNITSASVYRLVQQNKTLNSPDVAFVPTIARYWQLHFNAASGGIGRASPGLSLGWPVQTMVWNARGSAPFTLHVGEQPTAGNAITIESLIPGFTSEKLRQLPAAEIRFVSSAGHTPDTADSWSAPQDYKRWWLWAGLALGVLVLAGMVFSLLKSDH